MHVSLTCSPSICSEMKNYVASLKSQHESLISAFEHLSETTKLTKDLEMKYEDDIKVSYYVKY